MFTAIKANSASLTVVKFGSPRQELHIYSYVFNNKHSSNVRALGRLQPPNTYARLLDPNGDLRKKVFD